MTLETAIFTDEQIELLNRKKTPKHVAIIPDGNRRWAHDHFLTSSNGHQKGADALTEIVKAAKEIGIQIITLFTFSTENWTRPKAEINALMILLYSYLNKQLSHMRENGIRFGTIGQIQNFPKEIIEIVNHTKEETEHCKDIDLIFALNYGGRDDICRAVKKMVDDFSNKKLEIKEITESRLSSYLDTAPFPDPDLLIRAGGEQRISNFLLWQFSYTEMYLSETLWPDFKPKHLLEAVLDFQKRERRLGGA